MNICYYSGYWSTNIGNSFFQLGAEYLLKKCFPECDINAIGDEPGYIKPAIGNPQNSYNPLFDMSFDYLVILGPFVRKDFFKILAPTIKQIFENKKKYIALGVGMMEYNLETVRSVGSFLKEYPPEILTTRDIETYNALKNYVLNIYNGIDLGFFVSDIWCNNLKFIGEKYLVFNFDQLPEPKFLLDKSKKSNISIGDEKYLIKFNNFRRKMCKKGFIFQLLDRIFFPVSNINSINKYRIIRTDHRYNPIILSKIYKAPNVYSSDFPNSYLQIYKNSEITFSNRLHACVATLAFGRKAMLFTNSPRVCLFDRVKASKITTKPISINMDYLKEEKEKLIGFVKKGST